MIEEIARVGSKIRDVKDPSRNGNCEAELTLFVAFTIQPEETLAG